MKLSWSHAVLRVRDLDLMVSFYCDTLEFVVADRDRIGDPDKGPGIAFLSGSSSDHHQIALLQARGPEEATSLDHNAFRVETIADVKEMLERVAADERVPAGSPITHGNAVSVYFKDPEGNGIEVFCDTPWHVKQPQLMSWDPSMSDAEVLANIEAKYRETEEFSPMASYRAKKAKEFGEV